MSRVPIDEAGRLESLNRLDLLGSAPEERFDRITRLARRLLGTPAAVIALVGVDRVWLKSAQGMPPAELKRPGSNFERALCALLPNHVGEVSGIVARLHSRADLTSQRKHSSLQLADEIAECERRG